MNETGHGKCPSCPSSDAFYKFPNGSAFCFSCGHQERTDTLEQFKYSLSQGNKNKTPLVELPHDFDYYIPEEAAKWLNKYQLTMTELRENKIGWSDNRNSLIFPIFGSSGDLLFYQERYFGPNPLHPKYLTIPRGVSKEVIHLPKHHPESDRVVLVEDLISAIKVSRVNNCTPLFGSTIGLKSLLRLSKLFKRAVVWLDPDAKKKALEASLLVGELMPCSLIFSDKDPKEYLTADIRSYLA